MDAKCNTFLCSSWYYVSYSSLERGLFMEVIKPKPNTHISRSACVSLSAMTHLEYPSPFLGMTFATHVSDVWNCPCEFLLLHHVIQIFFMKRI